MHASTYIHIYTTDFSDVHAYTSVHIPVPCAHTWKMVCASRTCELCTHAECACMDTRTWTCTGTHGMRICSSTYAAWCVCGLRLCSAASSREAANTPVVHKYSHTSAYGSDPACARADISMTIRSRRCLRACSRAPPRSIFMSCEWLGVVTCTRTNSQARTHT